ncbi:MAG: hypothetical protein ACT4QE_26810 [Anaerolineales bacterium]
MHEHGLTVADITRRTGLTRAHIDNCLVWLQLEEEIQTLVLEGRLPESSEVARALLTLPAGKRRAKCALMLAGTSATIKMIEDFCSRIKERRSRSRASTNSVAKRASLTTPASEPVQDERLATPALTLATEACGQPVGSATGLPWADIRTAAQSVCQSCDLYETDLKRCVPEPAWSLLTRAANQTCTNCPLPKLRSVCSGCPSVELLKRLIESTQREVAHDCS